LLTSAHLQAATVLHGRLGHSWGDADRGLDGLRFHFPSNVDRSDVLVKAAAVDKLYSTRAGNIYWVANAITDVFSRMDESATDVELVDAISAAKRRLYPGSDRCHSFASKYCHFFVSTSRFPIFDSFALAAVNNVLGGRQRGLARDRSAYGDFFERIARLREHHLACDASVRELDRYLWLWGQWLAQSGKTRRVVNSDVYTLFTSKESAVKAQVGRLLP